MSDLTGDALIAAALAFATRAHHCQLDKAGNDYIAHPVGVAAALAAAGQPPEVIAAALLHDVVEDCGVTAADLAEARFPASVIQGVLAVTKDPTNVESRAAFIARAIADPVGRPVKVADVKNNADPARLALLPDRLAAHFAKKYARDLEQMGEAL